MPAARPVCPDAAPVAGVPRVNVLGVDVSAVSIDRAQEIILGWAAAAHGAYVICRDAHGLVLCQEDAELRDIHRKAALVTPDGMPLVWWCRAAGAREVTRVYGPDLMLALAARHGLRHFLYGGAPGVPAALAERLRSRAPEMDVVGMVSPPFRALDATEDARVVQEIRESGANIVWVGLGTPKQERWMATHSRLLPGVVLVGVGAAFDFHAGRVGQAPRWIQHSGMEWLFRMVSEPTRLGKRYLKVVPLFLLYGLLQASGAKRFGSGGGA